MTTVADLDALLVATAHERRRCEQTGDKDGWLIAYLECDRLLERRRELMEDSSALVLEPPC